MHAPTAPRPTPQAQSDRNPLTYALIKVCPECAGPILRGSSCMACAHCGWGRCE